MTDRSTDGSTARSTDRQTDQSDPGRRHWRDAVREFAFGMTGYEFARHAVETRAALESLFMVAVVGDMIGLPILPPYYALRLLPFVTPDVATWKRRVLREREFSDSHDVHLHGL